MQTGGYCRWRYMQEETNIGRFKDAFGAMPLTCHQIWTALRDAGKLAKTSKPVHLLLALRYLWKYDTQTDLGQFFHISSHVTVSRCVKEWVKLIASLLQSKMLSWTEADEDGMAFFMSVDGTHCKINEQRPFSTIWSTSETGHRQSGVKIISGRTNTIRHENPKSFGSCKVRQ
jgi:Helix-turn-helix of DDE superfamily endonuclease